MKSHFTLLLGCIIFQSTLFAQKSVNEPEKNFEFLWNLFNEKYASFEEKHIDWQNVYDTYRPLVNDQTPDTALFTIFRKMLQPLGDGHVSLRAKSIDSAFSASRPSRINQELLGLKSKRAAVHEMNWATLKELGFKPLQELGPTFRGNRLFAYSNNGKIGYLRFHRCFSKYVMMNGLLLNKQLNKIFKSFEGLDGLIIDIRINMGGDDDFSNKVAGRLTSKKVLSHYKQSKLDKETYGKLKPLYIKPRGKNQFLQKVFLLTNDRTVSAADVLALGLAQLDHVTLVGDNTNGSFSDIYSKKLPNGWKVNLSDERYLSPDKVNYEGVGVPVDIVAHTTREDIEQKNDRVLRVAMDFLGNSSIKNL